MFEYSMIKSPGFVIHVLHVTLNRYDAKINLLCYRKLPIVNNDVTKGTATEYKKRKTTASRLMRDLRNAAVQWLIFFF
jgi:hypothetical protein